MLGSNCQLVLTIPNPFGFVKTVLTKVNYIAVLLTKDNSLINDIENINDKKIPIKIDINILKDNPITLKVTDYQHEIKLESIIPEKSKTIPITKEIIKDTEIIKVSFTLTGTKEQIKKVKDLIIELGIEYE